MIQLVIADDEPVILTGLKKLIDWESLGICIVGEAQDGLELLKLIQQFQPDLLIADISMPHATGIEVMKKIYESSWKTKVILVTAYQEFAYVKDALTYGAVDYLMKPIDKSKLEEVIHKVVQLLRVQDEVETNRDRLIIFEQKDKSQQIEGFFDQLTEGLIRIKDQEKLARELGLIMHANEYIVLTLEIDRTSQSAHWMEQEKKLILFSLCNLTKELVEDRGLGFVVQKHEHICIILMTMDQIQPEQVAQELLENIQRFLKISVTISVSERVESLNELTHSYRKSLDILNQKFFLGTNRVLCDESIRLIDAQHGESIEDIFETQKDALLQTLLSKNQELLVIRSQELFKLIENRLFGRRETVINFFYRMSVVLNEELKEMGIDLTLTEQNGEFLGEITTFETYHELQIHVVNFYKNWMGSIQLNKESQQITFLKEYIESHYHEEISLESIAAMIYMNPFYLSSFFKKQMKKNFKNYLTDIRLKNAQKLLLQTDLKVYEIAEKVGYQNPRHFSDMFKKRYGKLPQDYKAER